MSLADQLPSADTPPPELTYIKPEHRLVTRRFRQYRRVAANSAEGKLRRELGLPVTAFAAKYEGRDKQTQQETITPVLHGTLDMPEGPAALRDVDDRDTDDQGRPAARGRPGPILDTVYPLRYLPDTATSGQLPEDVPVVRVSGHELRDIRTPQWPDRLGISGQYPVQGLAAVADLISAVSRSVRPRTVYAKTGVLRRSGRAPVWLRFGGPALMPTGAAAVTDDSARAELHPDYAEIPVLRELTFSEPSTDDQAAADLAALFSAIDVYPETPALPVAMIGLLGWAPFSSDNGRVADLVFGDSGEAGKTSIADALIVAAQSATHQAGPDVEGIVFNCRNKGTALGLDQAMHPARGAVVAADDIITRHLSRADLTKAFTKLDGILDGIAGGTGSVRGGHSRGRSTFSMNRAPTGCGFVTAEDIPAEDRLVSLMGRAAALSVANPSDTAAWSKNLGAVQDASRPIARAHSRFICDHLEGLAETGRNAVGRYRPVVAGWQREHGGHKRTINTYARLAAGWVLYAEHAARLTGQDARARIGYGLRHLEDMFRAQAARSGKIPGARPVTDPAELFARMTADVLSGGPGALYLADAELDASGAYQPPRGLGPADWVRLGWRSRQVTAGMGVREAVWEPLASGPPVGAVIVHDPAAEGRRPRFGMRLLVTAAELDRLTAAAAARALSGPVPLTLSGGLVLRDRLVTAGMLHSAVAQKQRPVWGKPVPRWRLVLDLAPVLAGTLGHDDPGPEPAGDPDPAPEPEPDEGPPLPPEPEPEPDYGGWGPGSIGAAAHGEPESASRPEPPAASEPAPPATAAQSRSGPRAEPPVPEPPRDGRPPARPAARTRPPRPERPAGPDRAERLADFDRAARKGGRPGEHAPERDMSAALDLYEWALGGLRFEGSPGRAGVIMFHWLRAKYGSVPELPRSPEGLAIVTGMHRQIRRDFSVTSPAAIGPDAAWVSGADVNRQYLAAGENVELGHGDPVRVSDIGPEHLKMPGYALADWPGFPGPFTAVKPGEWVAMPMAKLAVQWAAQGRCPRPAITEALVWPEHRRWLSLLCTRLKDGLTKLEERPGLPARIAADVIKQTYSGTIGGWLSSPEHNRTATLHPDWTDMARATGTANMWRGDQPKGCDPMRRGLIGCTPGPAAVVDPDAAYFAVAAEGKLPAGLTFSGQPGKWKPYRSCPLTDEIRAAIASGKRPRVIRDLIRAEDANYRRSHS